MLFSFENSITDRYVLDALLLLVQLQIADLKHVT